VQLRDGRTIHGLVKNESNFDLQLLGDDGTLYLLTKEQVVEIARSPSPTREQQAEAGKGISFEQIAHPELGAWPTYDGNLSGNRFSPLDQIQASNVNRLAPKWMFTLPGVRRSLQGTPIVVDGVMYVTSVNEAYALDARSGREIWHYSRPRSQHLAGDAAGGINRGVAVLGNRVFMVTDNAHLLALHRSTGQLVWDVRMADSAENYGSTSAPLIVNDLVVAGTSGGDEGVRGFLSAYKASKASAFGASGPSRRAASRDRKHGAAARWSMAADQHGSPAPTIRKRGFYIGPPEIRVLTTTATNAKATTCTPRRSWRSIRIPAN
jgi:alcohol dehydrogenase (cytochrome c)